MQVRAALQGRTLAGLINNAGVAWPAPLLHQPLADFQTILNANCCGVFNVTKVGRSENCHLCMSELSC